MPMSSELEVKMGGQYRTIQTPKAITIGQDETGFKLAILSVSFNKISRTVPIIK